MDGETPQSHREPTAVLMERLLDRERERSDRLQEQFGSVLARIDTRFTTLEARLAAIEARIGEALTPMQWVKALAGIGLPIAALWLTGSADIARSFVPH